MKKPLKTTPILDGAYLVVGLVPGLVGSPIGEVDLSKLTVERAERLLEIGFPYLRKAPKKRTYRRKPNGQFKVPKENLTNQNT